MFAFRLGVDELPPRSLPTSRIFEEDGGGANRSGSLEGEGKTWGCSTPSSKSFPFPLQTSPFPSQDFRLVGRPCGGSPFRRKALKKAVMEKIVPVKDVEKGSWEKIPSEQCLKKAVKRIHFSTGC